LTERKLKIGVDISSSLWFNNPTMRCLLRSSSYLSLATARGIDV
jgi:hypothetical protein